jgi:hypothetical protein
MSSANRSRKFVSGWQKHKKKQRIEKLVQSQQGAMDMFVTKQSQVSSDNPTPDQGQSIDNNIDIDRIDPLENNVEVEEALPDNTNTQIAIAVKTCILLRMLVILFSLIYLIQDIGIHLILNKLTF